MLDKYRLSNLPGYGKLFVAIFTTLMLLVVFWAMFIFYVSRGMVGEDTKLPAYLTDDAQVVGTQEADSIADIDLQETADQLQEDSEAVLAPMWDSDFAGREVHVDSATNVEKFRERDAQMRTGNQRPDDDDKPDFEENVGLAHTHVNGQTLLYFAMGFVFLFTSASPKIKKTVYWIFGISILLHAIGLTGQGYYGIFDDILAISGVALLVIIVYMTLLIYVDLGHSPNKENL